MRKSVLILSCMLIMMSVYFAVAYAASGADGPSPPSGEIIGQLLGEAQAVAVQGDYAYVGFENDLAVVDISDKTTPLEMGRLDLGEPIWEIAVSGEYAYAATSSGLQIVYISNPETPQWIEVYEQLLVTEVQIRDGLAFILSANGLEILSLANTPNLTQIGQYEAYMPSPVDLDFMNQYAFIRDGHPNDLLHILDVSNVSNPLNIQITESVSDKVAVTFNRFLAVNNACSSICFTWLSVSSWDPVSWEFSFIGAHDVYGSSLSLALEAGNLYAFAGKDIGLFVYNYHKQYIDGSPLQIDYFDISDVRDVVVVDAYVYAVSVDGEGIDNLPREGGLFILPAPPLHEAFLPFIDG